MNRSSWACAVLASVLVASSACRSPSLPPPDNPPVVQPPVDTWGETGGDTGAPLPCATPEVEPNDLGTEATPLPLEQPGCGELVNRAGDGGEEVLDRDTFAFTVEDAGWIAVEVERGDNSLADLQLRLDGPDDVLITKFNDTEDTDVTLKFPAATGDWIAVVSEEEGRGGEQFTYELLVSEAKVPVEWTRLEDEPNDSFDRAEVLTGTVSVFGTFDGNADLADRDWYEIQIPAGEHVLSIDVDAFEFGAAGDAAVQIRDSDNEEIDTIFIGNVGGQRVPDPKGTYRSSGDETIRLQVLEQDGREGPAHWYVLNLRLEAI